MLPIHSCQRIGVAGLVILLQCCATTLRAQEAAPHGLPVAAPLTFKEGAFLEKDYRQQESDWAEKHLVAPAKTVWQGKAWAADAERFCRAALDSEFLGRRTESPTTSLAPDATKLLNDGCDDPLVAWLAWRALYAKRGNWRDGEAALDVMITQLPNGRRVNGALAMFIGGELVRLAVTRSQKADSERNRLSDSIRWALSDESYDAASEPVLVRHCIAALETLSPENAASLSPVLTAIEESRYSPWAKNTLLGFTQKVSAWAERGFGWASSVSQEGWETFAAHLQKARGYLEAAWQLRPDRPEPAAAMITVSLGENSPMLEQRRWFDNAVAAQPDYPSAYQNMHNATMPRWQGSHEAMAQFGAACANTRRFDTAVPAQVFIAASNIAEEVPDTFAAFTAPAFGNTMRQTIEGYLAQKGLSDDERRLYASYSAVAAYLMHEPELCGRALEIAGPKLDAQAVGLLHSVLGHEAELRIETAALLGKSGPEARELLLKLHKRDLPGVHQFLNDTNIESLPADARSIFEEVASILKFHKQFDAGEWMPVTFRQGLTNAGRTNGRWSGTDKGELILEGDDTYWSECFFRFPVSSKDVEIRGQITFEIPDKSVVRDRFGFGPMLGWLPHVFNGGKPGTRGFITDFRGGREGAYVKGDGTASFPRRVPFQFPFPTECTFHLNIYDGKVTYIVNDQVIADRSSLKDIGIDDGRGFAGFTAFGFPSGARAIVTKLEMRKSTSAPPIPAAKIATHATQKSTTPASRIEQGPATPRPTITQSSIFAETSHLMVPIALVVMAVMALIIGIVAKFARRAQP